MNEPVFKLIISLDIFIASDISHYVIIVIVVPNRWLFPLETESSFVERLDKLDINRIVTSIFENKKYRYVINTRGIFTDCLWAVYAFFRFQPSSKLVGKFQQTSQSKCNRKRSWNCLSSVTVKLSIFWWWVVQTYFVSFRCSSLLAISVDCFWDLGNIESSFPFFSLTPINRRMKNE